MRKTEDQPIQQAQGKRPKAKSQFEHSAGGVIFRKIDRKFQILLIKDKNDQWSFPKGLIEQNEDPIKTAHREIAEEVGLNDLVFIDSIDSIRYLYRFKGNLIRKKVDYYLFEYKGKEKLKPQIEEGIYDVRWIDVDEALAMIGYVKTNKPILEKAIKIISDI